MRTWHIVAVAALMTAGVAAQTAPQSAVNGLHPDAHGPPPVEAAPAPIVAEAMPVVTVVAKQRRRHRRWKTTAGHIGRCKRHFRTYDARTNLYVARPGVRRRCVL